MPTHPPDDLESDREYKLWRDLSRLYEDYCGGDESCWPERNLEFKRINDRVFAPIRVGLEWDESAASKAQQEDSKETK